MHYQHQETMEKAANAKAFPLEITLVHFYFFCLLYRHAAPSGSWLEAKDCYCTLQEIRERCSDPVLVCGDGGKSIFLLQIGGVQGKSRSNDQRAGGFSSPEARRQPESQARTHGPAWEGWSRPSDMLALLAVGGLRHHRQLKLDVHSEVRIQL